jgi:hypothetical protein
MHYGKVIEGNPELQNGNPANKSKNFCYISKLGERGM